MAIRIARYVRPSFAGGTNAKKTRLPKSNLRFPRSGREARPCERRRCERRFAVHRGVSRSDERRAGAARAVLTARPSGSSPEHGSTRSRVPVRAPPVGTGRASGGRHPARPIATAIWRFPSRLTRHAGRTPIHLGNPTAPKPSSVLGIAPIAPERVHLAGTGDGNARCETRRGQYLVGSTADRATPQLRAIVVARWRGEAERSPRTACHSEICSNASDSSGENHITPMGPTINPSAAFFWSASKVA